MGGMEGARRATGILPIPGGAAGRPAVALPQWMQFLRNTPMRTFARLKNLAVTRFFGSTPDLAQDICPL